MRKEFYVGQPLIVKETGERVTFVYGYFKPNLPCDVVKEDGQYVVGYCEFEDLEPSTEFKFSEIIAGLEQGYFDGGTEFRMANTDGTIIVKQGSEGLYLGRPSKLIFLTSREINSTWTLVEHRKEMTLEEIEAKLGYKIKLKELC